MNKLGMVLGVAAVATLAGCKDPNYKPFSTYTSQNDIKAVEPPPPPVTPPVTTPVDVKPTCKCPPGTKHTSPCTCGAPDCQCVVVVKQLPPPAPVEPESTTYIVQNGDYLAKISKRYNISIASIKRLNGLKNDTIRVGQKLKLPGKVDVGVQQAPVKPTASAKKPAKAAPADYTGATKEYVVKSGDTLGVIAYGNGLNIRQLKKLNGLTGDVLKVGQKLKVPADGKAAATTPDDKASAPATKVVPPVKTDTPAKVNSNPPEDAKAEQPQEDVTGATTTPPPPPPPTTPATLSYTVQEGDDMTGVSIRYGASSAAIRELNNLPEDAQLRVGQVIKLPAEAQQ